ncbi:hypothetical protein ACVXZZ_12925 [Staphylococcus aureus]
MLGNINDFNPDTDSIPESELLEVIISFAKSFTWIPASTINDYENFDY